MTDLQQLIAEAQQAHVEAHGAECGLHNGGHPRDPCVVLRRAWVAAFPHEAKRQQRKRWMLAHPEQVNAIRRENHLINRDIHLQRMREYDLAHRETKLERQRQPDFLARRRDRRAALQIIDEVASRLLRED